MRTISQIAGDLMLDAAERRGQPPEPPMPRNEVSPGGSYTPMNLLDSLPANARVKQYGAMMSSDFIACETVKARAIRSLPVHVMRRGKYGPEKAEGHPLNNVLRRPNALMTWGDMAVWAQVRRDVFGTVYMRVYRDLRGNPVEIRPVLASVRIKFDRKTGIVVYSAASDYYNEAWSCREDDLVILKTDLSEDGGRTGKSIVEQAAEDIGLSIDLTRFYRALLENGNHFSGYFETDEKLSLEDVKAIKAKLDAMKGPDGAGQSPIFDVGLKYKQLSAKLEGMDLIEQERFVLEKVCRVCHVDPHHVHADKGAAATASSGYDLDFVKNTVLPEVKAWEEALQIVLDRARSLGGKSSEYYVKFNMAGLERGDIKTRYEAYRIGVYAGIITRAHACELEDIQWLPGQDKLLQPTAYYMVDEKGEPYVPAERTLGTSGQSDGVSGIDEKATKAHLGIFAMEAAERIARRAAADGDTRKTRDFAADVMKPVAYVAMSAGIDFDMDKSIDTAIEKGTKNGK